MKRIIIFSCTSFTKLLAYQIEKETSNKVLGFCVNENYFERPFFEGKPVYKFELLGEQFGNAEFEILIGAGYKGMNRLRQDIFNKCDEYNYEIGSFIHPACSIDAERIGRGNIISDGTRISPFTKIGDGNIIVNSVITHENIIGNFNYLSGTMTGGHVNIKNNCFLGLGSIIGDNVNIGDYNVIAAGTCLTKSVGDNNLISPAQIRITESRPEIMGRMFK